jgi:aryl-alcohol dehydrogenase
MKVQPGDHVVLSVLSCGACRSCQRGLPTYCANVYPLNFGRARPDGSTALRGPAGPVHGHFFGQSSFATYALATERNVVKVPAEAPLEFLGPLGCGVLTGAGAVLNALHPSIGSRIAVFGAGSVGLSAVMAARLAGCTTIVAVDPQASRRTLACELGATHALDPGEINVVEAIRDLTGGGADYTLDTTGSSSAALVRQAVDALTTPGVCGLVAAAPPGTELTLDRSSLFWGRSIRGIIMGDANPDVFIPALIDLHSQGRFPFDRLVALYRFDEINEAVAAAEEGRVVKPVLQM